MPAMAVGDISAANSSFLDPISGAIKTAAAATGVDFTFLFQQAKVESGLNAQAKAGTSSASGLFQFTKDTWLKVVEQHGDDMGLSSEASALRSGVTSAADRQKILDLRNNPEISARLAAHYAIDNAKALQAQGHKVTGPTDLYLAHFLGSGGAAKFLSGMKDNPNAPAAAILPSAANANKAIFYKDGAPASFNDIYQRFAKRFDGGAPVSKQSIQMAANVLAENQSPARVAVVDSLVQRLKLPDALSANRPKLAEQAAASGKPLADGSIAKAARPNFTSKAPVMPTAPRSGTAAPQPAPTNAPMANDNEAPVSVDSLAKFLDSASKWSADPGKMNEQAQKGLTSRDASDGVHSHPTI
jgi:hypothetical protein